MQRLNNCYIYMLLIVVVSIFFWILLRLVDKTTGNARSGEVVDHHRPAQDV